MSQRECFSESAFIAIEWMNEMPAVTGISRFLRSLSGRCEEKMLGDSFLEVLYVFEWIAGSWVVFLGVSVFDVLSLICKE